MSRTRETIGQCERSSFRDLTSLSVELGGNLAHEQGDPADVVQNDAVAEVARRTAVISVSIGVATAFEDAESGRECPAGQPDVNLCLPGGNNGGLRCENPSLEVGCHRLVEETRKDP